ncbi:hypothetical protein K474DRAFT_1706763 [Panus rudis PR-1116 ss-1]|nr:hypothetical protein K474DRAFT_1706763 [Panus rudis PR-1116 ss-1]
MSGKTSFSEPSSPLSHRDLAKLDIKSPLFRSTPILQPIASRPIHFLHNARSQSEWLQPRRSRLERLEEISSLENSGHSGGLPFLSRPFNSPLAGRTSLTGKASPGLPWRSSSSSSASSPEFVVPGPSRSPLLGEELEQAQATSIMFSPHSSMRGAPSPRSFHTLSSVAPSPNPQSPPSATALSATELHAPRQMHALHVSTSPLPREFPAPGSRLASSVGSVMQHLTHHSTFYFSVEMVVLRVEDTLYRLHWDQLRKHTTYFDELILAQEAENSRHLVGKTDETALNIPNVTQPAFDVLLYFLHDGIFEQEKITLKDWITLLAVSSQLKFEKIRTWAIKRISEQLPDIEPVAIIVLATRYDVPQWLTSAYTTLCTRETPLADEEAEELGATTTARIARTREAILEENYRILRECVSPNDVEQKLGKLDITRMIKHAFPQAAGAAGVSGLL